MAESSDISANAPVESGHGFGTFSGVFTPSILTIFGLVMFMLTGFVVGKTGVFDALLILLIAQSITLATGLSISAISTNTPVKGGGAYFLISRALGPGFGSSIGLTLFSAQALSVPFYIIGFAGAVAKNFSLSMDSWIYWLLLFVPAIVLFILSWVGAGWAIKLQFVILAILGSAIVVFLLGPLFFRFNLATLSDNMGKQINDPGTFFTYFAIFFPAVTGIMAGVNMSGDLKEPSKSIPKGTLAAIGVGAVVYGIQMIIMGGSFGRGVLIDRPYEALVENALFGTGFIVIAGVIAATLSSALGSFLGAPRVLQALARDKIIPVLNPFAKGEGGANEPRRALLLTFAITLGVLFWAATAGPNAITMVASVVTMFFLYTYGMVNLALFVESFGANPSFRPRFRYYHWFTALFGACACIMVSLLIDPKASILALSIIAILYYITRKRQMEINFGDARRGFVYSRIRNNLLQLDQMPPDPKNWRPTITVLTGNPHTRHYLLEYASLFEGNCGIISVVRIMVGDRKDLGEKRQQELENLRNFSEEHDLRFFPEVLITKDFDQGLNIFLQSHSLGPLKPNIVLTGWPNDEARLVPYFSHMRMVLELNMSYIAFVNHEKKHAPKYAKGNIDVWWRGLSNGSLMLILAHLLANNDSWKRINIRILRTIPAEKFRDQASEELNKLVESARLDAEIKIIVSEEPFNEIFRKESADSTVIFMGLRAPEDDFANKFFEQTEELLKDMPPTFLVSSSGEADLLA